MRYWRSRTFAAEHWKRLRTTNSFGPPQPNAASTDPFVAAALSETANAETVPSASQPPPDVLTTRITVTAFGSRNTPVIRSAIVRFGALLPRGYEVLAWQDGS
jgi:hypothetical protein